MEVGGIIYKCFRCGRLVSYEKIKMSPDLKCPNCGFKILVKVRPKIVKKVKAV